MNNILILPKKEKRTNPLPRQRVFYIGFRYVGPYLCQDVQNLYLKWNGFKNVGRKWDDELIDLLIENFHQSNCDLDIISKEMERG